MDNIKLPFILKSVKNKPSDNKTGSKYHYYGTGGIAGYTDEYLVDVNYIGGGESPTSTTSNSEEESKIKFYFLLRHFNC